MKNNDKYYNYLFDLQASGETNMWGAERYLMEEFNELTPKQARTIVLDWMQNYSDIKLRLQSQINN